MRDASFDGFHLIREHYSNNSSATFHDVASDKIAWFGHSTKQGHGANWHGTSGGAEGDMLREILENVEAKGFIVTKIVMDHYSSTGNTACGSIPEI